MAIIAFLLAAYLAVYLLGCTIYTIGSIIWWIIQGIVELILMILTPLVRLSK